MGRAPTPAVEPQNRPPADPPALARPDPPTYSPDGPDHGLALSQLELHGDRDGAGGGAEPLAGVAWICLATGNAPLEAPECCTPAALPARPPPFPPRAHPTPHTRRPLPHALALAAAAAAAAWAAKV